MSDSMHNIRPINEYHAIENQPSASKCHCDGRRYYTAILLSLAITCEYLMRINLSVAIEPMSCQFNWNSTKQGFILSSFYIGYTFGNFIGGALSTKYGGKNVLIFSVLSTSILTLFVPFCTSFHVTNMSNVHKLNCKCEDSISNGWCFHNGLYTNKSICNSIQMTCNDKSYIYLLIILRIFMGLFEAFSFPALFAVLKGWTIKSERSKLLCIAMSGGYFGTMIGFPLSTLMINSYNKFYGGWTQVFYLFTFVGFIWTILFSFTVFNHPTTDIFISHGELTLLLSDVDRNKNDEFLVNSEYTIPWKNMLTNKVAWACYIGAFSCNFINYTLLTDLPTYLNDELNYDLSRSLFISILPFFASFVMQTLSGYIVDFWINRKILSRLNARRLAYIIGVLFPAILLLICAYLNNSTVIVCLIILAAAFMGFAASTFMPNFTDISPTLSNCLFGVCNTIATIPGVVAPIIIGVILDSFKSENNVWKFVFWIVFLVASSGTLFYCRFTRTETIPMLNIEWIKHKNYGN